VTCPATQGFTGLPLRQTGKYTDVSLQQYKVAAAGKSCNGTVNNVKCVKIRHFPFRSQTKMMFTRRLKIGSFRRVGGARRKAGKLLTETKQGRTLHNPNRVVGNMNLHSRAAGI
jgi:hypothetical protein